MEWGKGQDSPFGKWIPNFSCTICWTDSPPPELPWYPNQLTANVYVHLQTLLCSPDVHIIPTPGLNSADYCRFTTSPESGSESSLLFFKTVLVALRLSFFQMYCRSPYSVQWAMLLKFWFKQYWIYRHGDEWHFKTWVFLSVKLSIC